MANVLLAMLQNIEQERGISREHLVVHWKVLFLLRQEKVFIRQVNLK